jgi:hypothetical protein
MIESSLCGGEYCKNVWRRAKACHFCNYADYELARMTPKAPQQVRITVGLRTEKRLPIP